MLTKLSTFITLTKDMINFKIHLLQDLK